MAEISIQERINSYIMRNPDMANKPDSVILSCMLEQGEISQREIDNAKSTSAFGYGFKTTQGQGTTLEHIANTPITIQTPQNLVTPNKPTTHHTELTNAQAQTLSIQYLSENLQDAFAVIMRINNGLISEGFDAAKNFFNTELSSRNVKDVISKEEDGIRYLTQAQAGRLTKKEYYEQNKERLKEMLMGRYLQKDDTGVDYLDKYRGQLSREQFSEQLNKYLTDTINTINTMEGIKDFQHRIIMSSEEEQMELLSQIGNAALGYNPESTIKDLHPRFKINTTPHPFNSEELMTFEETYLLERGVEFSKDKISRFQQSKGEMTFALSAHNKYVGLRTLIESNKQMYKDSIEEVLDPVYGTVIDRKQNPIAEERKANLEDIVNEYFAGNLGKAKEILEDLNTKQQLNLVINQDSEGNIQIDFAETNQTEEQKNKSIDFLLNGLQKNQESRLNDVLNNKPLDYYTLRYEQSYELALGKQNADELAKAMEEQNITFIDKSMGAAGMLGMGMMVGGKILTFIPMTSGIGVATTALGTKLALGSMAVRNTLGIIEANTREEKDEAEISRRYKELALDLGGMLIGSGAGIAGSALKTKVAVQGAGLFKQLVAEHGTDFAISVLGDMAMIGAMDYDQSIGETLRQNGVGIMVSTITGINVGKGVYANNFDPSIKTDVPETDVPKVETPEIDVPKVETPETDVPKVDLPKVVEPKTDFEVKVDTPEADIIPEVGVKVEPEQIDVRTKLLEAKDGDKPRFDATDISKILLDYSSEKAEALEKLLEAKDGDKPRFDAGDISDILFVYSSEKAEALEKLLEAKDGNELRFTRKDVFRILAECNSNKADLLNQLLNIQGILDSPRFEGDDIIRIMNASSSKNKDVIIQLANLKEKEGFRFYSADEILDIASEIKENNKEILDVLLGAQNNGAARFSSGEIADILKVCAPENVDVLKQLLDAKYSETPRFGLNHIRALLLSITPENKDFVIELANIKEEEFDPFYHSGIYIAPILRNVTKDNKGILRAILNARNDGSFRYKNSELVAHTLTMLSDADLENFEKFLAMEDEDGFKYTLYQAAYFTSRITDVNLANMNSLSARVDALQEMCLKSPDRYINGEVDVVGVKRERIETFFRTHANNLIVLSQILDKEAMNTLMRKRLKNVAQYLGVDGIYDMNKQEIKLLSDLCNSTNIDGKPFLPTQKIEFIDLLNAYKFCELDTAKLQQMAKDGKIDIAQLHIDLSSHIMKKSGLTSEEIASIPIEKIAAWDKKNIHFLAKELNTANTTTLRNLIRAGNLEADFMKYIHDTENIYGQTNARTQEMFAEANMNYEAWINPSKNNEIKFTAKDKNLEQLQQIVSQVEDDINILMDTPVKGFLKKQFPKFIKDDKFILPAEYTTSKAKLLEFVKILSDTSEQGQLSQVWKRAQNNATNANSEIATRAKRTLTVLNHLEQKIKVVESIDDIQSTKTFDVTIKMWDRNPQKDLFQGNYSTCCIGMGNTNSFAMSHYILNTSYNMIELVDNNTGETIGNALCYFVKGEDGKPAFIIDNIEINDARKPSNDVGAKLRDYIGAYASSVAKEVTGQDDVPIYMGDSYNDVPCNDLPRQIEKISFLGDVDCEEIYMDLYDGHVTKDQFTSKQGFLKITPDEALKEITLKTQSKDMFTIVDGKQILKPKYEKELYSIAKDMRESALKVEADIVQALKDSGFELEGCELQHRSKSIQSLFDKLKNYLLEDGNDSKTIQNAINSVHDAIGTRLVMPEKDYTKHPQVKELLDAGEREKALRLAAYLQSKDIQKVILAVATSEDNPLKAKKISNYRGKGGTPYFTDAQIEPIKYAIDNPSLIRKVPENDEIRQKLLAINNVENEYNNAKVRGSGYTAYQMNFEFNGMIFEFQFRGRAVNDFAEGEHIPYDIRTGKDIIGKDTQLKELYEPMNELLMEKDPNEPLAKGMTEDEYKAYNKYLTDYYNYLRKKELGFDEPKPLLTNTKYKCPYDDRLVAENLMILHEVAEKLKKNKITPEQAMAEYESRLIRLNK